MKKTAKIILISAIILIITVTIVMTVLRASGRRDELFVSESPGIGETAEAAECIKIYVTGEVVNPGIIEIEKGSTILDAAEACGGFTEEASSNINLVYVLDKNVTLIIKGKEDGGGVKVLEDSGDAIMIDEENGIIDGKININHADADALSLLPGIGEKTAADIINYRNSNGFFSCIEDIMNVSGIKENKFSQIKDYICIE